MSIRRSTFELREQCRPVGSNHDRGLFRPLHGPPLLERRAGSMGIEPTHSSVTGRRSHQGTSSPRGRSEGLEPSIPGSQPGGSALCLRPPSSRVGENRTHVTRLSSAGPSIGRPPSQGSGTRTRTVGFRRRAATITSPPAVEQAGFEPAVPCAQGRCGTRLRYCSLYPVPVLSRPLRLERTAASPEAPTGQTSIWLGFFAAAPDQDRPTRSSCRSDFPSTNIRPRSDPGGS